MCSGENSNPALPTSERLPVWWNLWLPVELRIEPRPVIPILPSFDASHRLLLAFYVATGGISSTELFSPNGFSSCMPFLSLARDWRHLKQDAPGH